MVIVVVSKKEGRGGGCGGGIWDRWQQVVCKD